MKPSIRVTRETHEPPATVEERITRAGGTNCFGEPNFRVVWGGSRLSWIGGRWTDHDAHGNRLGETIELRRVPKYAALDRWHIERWMPAESYGSPDEWYERTVETEDGAVEWARRQPRSAGRAALAAREEHRQHDFDRAADAILSSDTD